MRACWVVIPILDRTSNLPFDHVARVFDRQSELAARPHDGSQGAVTLRGYRFHRHRDTTPAPGKSPATPLLFVSNQLVARGEVVIVGGSYGVRITEVRDAAERVRSMEVEW